MRRSNARLATLSRPIAVVIALAPLLAGCFASSPVDALTSVSKLGAAGLSLPKGGREKECLVRAMYFESNRSSEEGLLAVGTVVMNRVASPKFPDTICKVVGQPNQFANGVMTRPMTSSALPKIEDTAGAVLRGKRHRAVGSAMFFHAEGYTFPYTNMHYVTVAGGNAFYKKL